LNFGSLGRGGWLEGESRSSSLRKFARARNEKIWGRFKEIIHLLTPQIGVNLVAHVQRIDYCLKF